MVKIGVIGLPGKWSTEVLADAVETKTGFRLVIDMQQVRLDLSDGALYFHAHNLCGFDGLMVKKISEQYSPNALDRLELLRIAEQAGVRVFSPALNILRLIDRLSCTVTLRHHNIPMPPTSLSEDVDAALQIVQGYGSAIFKPLYSTKARGMMLLDAAAPESAQRQQIELFRQSNPMMYIQKKLALPGRDLGMVFLGGEYLGTYARVSNSDAWNTTIHSGGSYAPYEASDELIELARKAQQPFGMDFTTVDVAESEIGPIVFEVSAFGGFKGVKEGIGLNAAELYVDYAIKALG
ncbi:MAG: GAK system ATP-grasp enzyme [Mariprofundus sp.]|nr:GAK system ATP-grasp enzyme [Mariprofundus sp.]